ncbi:MAG: hypothetical protein ACI9VI_002342 [Candidatus Azotimanducaceae bacterium]|jgi:hypothetical protein
MVAATTFILGLMGSLGVHFGLRRHAKRKIKAVNMRLAGVFAWFLALPFAITQWGIELGICWWLMLLTLSMAMVCVADYLTRTNMNPGLARDVANIEAEANLREKKPKILASIPWLGLTVFAFIGAVLTCMVLVVVLPGSSKDVIAFTGLLVPIAAGALIFIMGSAVNAKTAAKYILIPTVPSLAIILVEMIF